MGGSNLSQGFHYMLVCPNSYLARLSDLIELFEILLPLHRQEVFFHIVAGFAAGHHISAAAFPTAGNRHDVIHGQLFGRRWACAVITFTLCDPAFPPLGFPEFPGLAAFAFQIRFFQIIGKRLNGLSFFHLTFFLKQAGPTSRRFLFLEFRSKPRSRPDPCGRKSS
jgi:hypothetical protein